MTARVSHIRHATQGSALRRHLQLDAGDGRGQLAAGQRELRGTGL